MNILLPDSVTFFLKNFCLFFKNDFEEVVSIFTIDYLSGYRVNVERLWFDLSFYCSKF